MRLLVTSLLVVDQTSDSESAAGLTAGRGASLEGYGASWLPVSRIHVNRKARSWTSLRNRRQPEARRMLSLRVAQGQINLNVASELPVACTFLGP
jgi:hypothetical protein